MPAFTDYQIAAGWNNAAGLQKIGLVTATSNIKFPEPGGNRNYVEGRQFLRLDLDTSTVGVDKHAWIMSVTFEQYLYYKLTYKGKVTIRTHWFNRAFSNYNAMSVIPSLENSDFDLSGPKLVPFTFYDLRAL